MTPNPKEAEYLARYVNTLMQIAHVDLSFALAYMSQRQHTFHYGYPPELQARMEIICWPGVTTFFT